MKIGFIGLGAMGRPMALHLLHRGYPLGIYARRPQTAVPLTAAGAISYSTPAALGEASDVVITMLMATSDVEEILLGPDGASERARPGTVFIDMSTISSAAAVGIGKTLAARGLAFVDAPVSGGPIGAENAALTIMVGADTVVLEHIKPILDCFGTLIVHVGGVGAGQTTKACHQLVLLITAEAVAEGLALAARSGLDPHLVRQALLGGLASSRVLDVFGGRMVNRRFESGIPVRLYDKDLHIVFDTAGAVGQPLPAFEVVRSNLEMLMARGDGEKDLSVLMEVLEGPAVSSHCPEPQPWK
jgi:2-hydroxy-3-oxopropionate reductase